MTRKDLKNKPLVEAVLEIRWALTQKAPGAEIDPHYKFLLGRVFDRFQSEYPEYEQLPAAMIPEEMIAHVVQHRFRKSSNGWPLVQLGPGIFTVNDTESYVWSDFQPRCSAAVTKLFEAYPKPSELRISSLSLRYIDAVEFDYTKSDMLAFLREYLKINISLPTGLFDKTGIETHPQSAAWTSSYRCAEPKGMVHLRFSTGQKKDTPSIVWETNVQSAAEDVPSMPDQFGKWLDSAHVITDDWFFKLIEGELERRFSGE